MATAARALPRKAPGIARIEGDHATAEAAVVGDRRAVVGQVDVGHRLQGHGNAGSRSEQEVANAFGVLPQGLLGADGQIDHAIADVDAAHPLPCERGLDGVEDVGRGQSEEGQALEVDVGADDWCQSVGVVAHRSRARQTAQSSRHALCRDVEVIQVLPEFAGAREDPFFFDLNQFFAILPDRATPLTGKAVSNPDTPQVASFRPPGAAKDFLAGYNVLSVVVELPKSMLAPGANKKIHVWCTTSK